VLIFHNPDHHGHAGRHEMFRGKLVPCVESPDRVARVLAEFRRRGFGEPRTAAARPDAQVLGAIHAPGYLAFLETAWSEWIALDAANASHDILPSVWPHRTMRHDFVPANFSAKVGLHAFDAGSPITSGTWTAACSAAACAVEAAKAVARGEDRCALAATRPPGHHAGRDFYGGYCFLNNAALAAQALLNEGHARVAVLDVDYHHGNGTQAIFEERDDVLTVSIHGDPRTEYPFYLGHAGERGRGRGEGWNLNLPLPKGSGWAQWAQALDRASRAVADSHATALVVPLGVDTYEGDPISGFLLRSEHYVQIGRLIGSLNLPTVVVLEGGYAVDAMGVNVANVAEGLAQS
jgi:acetoin utilization deacetylase AcuC-like enzyme